MNFFDYFLTYYVQSAFGSTYIITELISCLCISIAFNSTNVKKWKDWLRLFANFAIVFTVYIFLACSNYYILEANDLLSAANKYSRFYVWPIVTFLHTLYPTNRMKLSVRLTFATMISTSLIYAIAISGGFGTYITDTYGLIDKSLAGALTDFTLYAILIFLIGMTVLFKVLSPYKFHFLKLPSTILLISAYVISYIAALFVVIFDNEQNLQSATTQTCIILIDVITYTLFYFNTMSYNKLIDLQSQKLKMESERQQIEISESKYTQLHEIRHELQNQMSILSELIKNKKYDELEKYFADINEETRIAMEFVSTGNSVIDTVMNMEMSKAKSHGMTIRYGISVPKEMNFKTQDLISLLTNLIDNAIEAQIRYGLNDPINVKVIYEEPYFIVEVENSISKDVNKAKLLSLQSSKKDRLNHGYGVKIIKEICEKYEGVAKYTISDDGRFNFSGMLNNKLNED